jgi:hypothetical protein
MYLHDELSVREASTSTMSCRKKLYDELSVRTYLTDLPLPPQRGQIMRLQFSLLGIMGIVAFVALAFASLIRPSYLWISIVWTAAIGFLAISVVAAVARRGESRCFWASFALFGWGYMALTLGPWFEDRTGELLATRLLLDSIGHRLGYTVPDHSGLPGIWVNLPYAQGQPPSRDPIHYCLFLVSGHSLLAIMMAFGGGCLGRLLCVSREMPS